MTEVKTNANAEEKNTEQISPAYTAEKKETIKTDDQALLEPSVEKKRGTRKKKPQTEEKTAAKKKKTSTKKTSSSTQEKKEKIESFEAAANASSTVSVTAEEQKNTEEAAKAEVEQTIVLPPEETVEKKETIKTDDSALLEPSTEKKRRTRKTKPQTEEKTAVKKKKTSTKKASSSTRSKKEKIESSADAESASSTISATAEEQKNTEEAAKPEIEQTTVLPIEETVEKKENEKETFSPVSSEKEEAEQSVAAISETDNENKKTKTVRFVPLQETDFEPSFVREITSERPPFKPLRELYDPISAMLAEASTNAHTGLLPGALRNVAKYGVIALVFTWVAQTFLNRQAFGFARMTFSDSSWLFLRIVFAGLLLEAVDAFVLNGLAGHKTKRGYLLRLVDICSAAGGFLALIFSVSFALFFVQWQLGFIVLASAAYAAVLLRAYAYSYTYQCGRRRTLLAMIVIAALNTLLILLLIRLCGGDLIRIVQSYIRL